MSARAAIRAVRDLAGLPAVAAHPLGAAVFEVETEDGDLVVTKREATDSGVFAQVAGLVWLAEPGAVPVPSVRGWDAEWIILDHVEPGPPSAAAAERLGRGLADAHAWGAPAFGSPPGSKNSGNHIVGTDDYYGGDVRPFITSSHEPHDPVGPADAWIGLAPMRCRPAAAWGPWYAADRIEPYLRRSVDLGRLTTDEATVIGTVRDRIDDLAGPIEPPARLHGDLWNGNVLWSSQGRAWLIDPAAHGGHRETDLAMLALFGCPHLDRVLAAYHEHRPLAPGWRARVPLHQLFPLLVHTVLFGGGYGSQAVAAARAALRA